MGGQSLKESWIVVMTAAMFFFYEFIQGNMFNSIAPDIMSEFGLGATRLGWLTGTYFIANMIFLIPAGYLLDHYSTRKIILSTMIITILGTQLLALTDSYPIAIVCRFMTGIGAAFCFIACIRLASRWFPPRRMAFVTGMIVTMAMSGGFVAQTPLTLLVKLIGWREAMWVNASLGVVIALLIHAYVKDQPSDKVETVASKVGIGHTVSLWEGIRRSYFNRQNILAALYTSLMNAPIAVLGAMVGNLFLVQVYGLTATKASYASSAIFLGTIIGSPLVGRLSDHLNMRRLPMLIGAILAANAVWLVIAAGEMGLMGWVSLFFALGLLTSTQVLAYPTVAESNPAVLTATSVSVVSMLTQGGIALYQPLFGWLLKQHWDGQMQERVPVYSAGDYHLALLMLLVGVIIAFAAAYFLRETYGNQQK